MAYNPDGMIDFEAYLALADLAYTKFICRFAGQSPAPVTRKEHTTFLLYWLCHNLFCTQCVTGPPWLLTRYETIQVCYASVWICLSNFSTGQIFYGQYCRNRPPIKSTAEADQLSAMGNPFRRFFKLVSFRPNHTGVIGFHFTVTWDAFCERIFILITSHPLRKVLHPEAVPFSNKDISLNPSAQEESGKKI
uniref:Aminotransferase-like plant mobile domain-containing protein n=1 Tax=Ananas comosus var. bracteatus TaxID=296719 RepID=A0A6V7NJ00_ANACO|nr:unnamed protein product [Ananas comosus var. bracteatus]